MNSKIISYLEHTVLKPAVTTTFILNELNFALNSKVSSFVIHPYYVKLADEKITRFYNNSDVLKTEQVKLCTVIGFPLGYNSLGTKLFEINEAVNNGADEVDIVLNNTLVASENFAEIDNELKKINKLVSSFNRKIITKIIIETSLLNNDFSKISIIIELLIKNNIDFVKTSTGFVGEGAKIDTIKKIKEKFGDRIKIKASGGIKTLSQVEEFISAGADKIGLSSSRTILS